ncbi:MAG: amidohydrolase family protein [Candidatus Limnocylindrales bacterium]
MTRTVFTGARVFDGTGADPYPADVVIEGERIVLVGPVGSADADTAIDVGGKTLLPGLFDTHTHVVVSTADLWQIAQRPFSLQFFEAARNLRATLAAGITTVRDAGGADLGVKQAVEQGLVSGPRVQISLVMLSQTGGHGDDWLPSGDTIHFLPPHPGLPGAIVDGPDGMRRKVRELQRMGAEVVKVATSGGVLSTRDDPRHAHFRRAELDVLVEEAAAAGMFVMAHAQGAEGIKNAVRAGIRSIEHGVYLDDEGIELMLERGTWLVPTLVAPQGVVDAIEAGASLPPAVEEKARAAVETHRTAIARAVEAGVRIAMGTDSGITAHGQNLAELSLMVECGLTPPAALEATTRSAAQLMGLDADLGTIEPGKLADLVVLEGDPYRFDGYRDRVIEVWQAGRLVVGSPS